ncbi:hypothetical protein E2562_033094 [Oryza meyeriana var. granulata]|uniref:Uncharacterized protein n=1 Tax=Oryza meyeriana var. granulata TaxID=110450 RepID=A0A6G1DRJ7_9ORYZ|nr:hypothetical protein E2562_033094 [Oryza meyeriana var. granulata]
MAASRKLELALAGSLDAGYFGSSNSQLALLPLATAPSSTPLELVPTARAHSAGRFALAPRRHAALPSVGAHAFTVWSQACRPTGCLRGAHTAGSRSICEKWRWYW